MIHISTSHVETELLGRPVIDLLNIADEKSLRTHAHAALKTHRPILMTCKLPAKRVDLIDAAEEIGFRMVECQIYLRRPLYGKPEPIYKSRFTYSSVECDQDLEEILEFAPATFQTDRFSLDPHLGPEFAARRYHQYIQEAYTNPEQGLFCLRDEKTKQIVMFHSFRKKSAREVQGLLEAARPDRQGEGLADIFGSHINNLFKSRGFRVITTAVSAANFRTLSRLLHYQGQTISKAMVALHKHCE